MRPLLSQFQTPTAPRRVSRFFSGLDARSVSSSFSSRHARLEHGLRHNRNVFSLAPRCRFWATSDRRSRVHSADAARLKLAPRNGLSLACSDCFLSKAPAAGSMLLAYLFGLDPELFSQPVRLFAPTLAPFIATRGSSLLKPVADFRIRDSWTSYWLSLPFRTCIPADQSAQPASHPRSLPQRPARFPIAPR